MNFHIIEGSHIFVRPVNKILPSSAFMDSQVALYTSSFPSKKIC